MSKLATVQALSDSAPLPERLRATMELQTQIEQVSALLREASEMTSHQRQQMLDLAALMEPIPERLAAIEQRQQAMESLLQQVVAVLPAPVKSPQDDRPRRPRLASRDDLAAVPAKVWESKPSLFSKS